ncbi:MAG: T9SS type A sorting domain-containing protein [Flavobacteriales bacterium]
MKKVTLLLALLLLNVMVFAQTRSTNFLNEDFSSGVPPTGWTIDGVPAQWSQSSTDNAGGNSPEAKLHWTNGNNSSYLISPEVDLTGETEVVFSFRHFLDDFSGTSYTIGVATRSGGGSWNTVWSINPTGNMGPEIRDIQISNGDVGASDFQVALFLEGNFYNFNDWFLDDLVLYSQDDIDAQMLSVNMPTYSESGDIDVSCTIKNLGISQITSLDVNYEVDGGGTVTQTLNGLGLNSLDEMNFTFDTPWTGTPGEYTINIWVSNINGGGDDDDQSNNEQTQAISIATGFTANVPLFEEFTSSTCGPCASFNSTSMGPFMAAHPDDIAVIKYQMSWPGAGDPYYTEEGGVRRAFYGVNAIPDLFGGGYNVATNTGALNSSFNTQSSKHAFFEMNIAFSTNGNVVNMIAEIDPFITASLNVQIAIIEKETTQNTGGNGETYFEHVMMKMLPDASGTNVDFVAGTTTTISESFDMSSTNVEEMDDLALVVFIQDVNTREVLQSAFARNENLGVNDSNLSSVSMYPNPSNGTLNIKTEQELEVTIFDVLGKKVFTNAVLSNETFDISHLNNGIYLVKLSSETSSTTKKLIVRK